MPGEGIEQKIICADAVLLVTKLFVVKPFLQRKLGGVCSGSSSSGSDEYALDVQ
jgi:hypothetical protein